MKLIVFDVYGTLLDVFSVQSKCELFAPGKGEKISQTWRVKQIDYTRLRSMHGKTKYKSFWEITKDSLNYALLESDVSLSAEKFDSLLSEYLRLKAFSENIEVLKHLKFIGFKLAVLSNGNINMVEDALKNSKIYDEIDCIMSADELMVYKVNPDVYGLIQKYYNIKLNDILFVSSNHWDIVGAGWSGLKTFWVNRANQKEEILDYSADAKGKNLSDLQKFLCD